MLDRLLTLRVDFRDEQAAAEITPERAARYLTAKGWIRGDTDKFACYSLGEHTVMVPQHSRWVDYGRRVVGLVNDLAEIEGRSPLAIWTEMRHG